MARILALNTLLFLTPFAVYGVWLLATRRNVTGSVHWSARVLVTLGAIGAVAVFIGLVILASSGDQDEPGSRYIPAQRGEDGQIIPGRFEND